MPITSVPTSLPQGKFLGEGNDEKAYEKVGKEKEYRKCGRSD